MKKLVLFLMLLLASLSALSQIDCVVVQWDEAKENYTVVNYNFSVSSLPVSGLSENLEVLIKRYPYSVPSYDPRLKVLVTELSISEDFDSEHSNNRKWIRSYNLLNRSITEKIISIEEAEANVNYKVMPTDKQLKYLLLYGVICRREAQGLTVSEGQQQILDKVEQYGLKIWNNHINSLLKKSQIEAGQLVDLDSDWEDEEPSE